MLKLYFEGFFQCRLATDPDPSDDPQGISGPTFAAAGEQDLDRIIRLQNAVSLRLPFVQIGVSVTRVTVQDAPIPNHPLLGANVELLDGAKFEGRNFIIAGTGREPIDPFHLRISGNGITLQRKDLWDPMNPALTLLQVTPEVMDRRQPTFDLMDAETQEAAGVTSPVEYRQARLQYLQSILPSTTDPLQRAALTRRIQELERDNQGYVGITSFAQIVLTVKETFRFDLNGPVVVVDPERTLGPVATKAYWPLEFWMGGYDCDTMCGYMRGKLSVPVIPAPLGSSLATALDHERPNSVAQSRSAWVARPSR
jgi:hypothetical protein